MTQLLTGLALTIEYIAVFVLNAGFCKIILISIPKGYSAYKLHSSSDLYTVVREMRLHLGQTLLLGLEILIVSEVIFSVSHRTLEEVSIGSSPLWCPNRYYYNQSVFIYAESNN